MLVRTMTMTGAMKAHTKCALKKRLKKVYKKRLKQPNLLQVVSCSNPSLLRLIATSTPLSAPERLPQLELLENMLNWNFNTLFNKMITKTLVSALKQASVQV